MNFRRSKNSHLPWRTALWFVVILAIVLVFLNRTPLAVDVELPAEEPVELTRDTPSDVVVVIDWQAVRNSPATFSGRDFSAAWINTLEQEIGPITIATPTTLTARVLDEARVIILTSSVAQNIPDGITKTLRDYALAGKLLIVAERPAGELREKFGANGRVGLQRGRKFSWVRDLGEPTRANLLDADVDVEFVGSTTPKENATTWLSVDGAPVVYSVPIGEGSIVVVDFDFGEFMVSSQQGRPREDFSLASTTPSTTDLAVYGPGNRFPVADTVERYLIHGVIGRLTPLPTFWPFPSGSEGVIVSLHTDRVLGNGGAWMLRYEASREATSTLLTSIDSGFDAQGYELVNKLSGEVGLLWLMQNSDDALMESFGLGPIRPFARPRTLESQVSDFEKNVGIKPIAAQVAGNVWTTDWVAPLRAMSSQGIRLDFSYSPGGASGYRFGTGFPFLALDESGLPLSIRVLPIVVPQDAGEGPTTPELLTTSAAVDHQVITIASRPASFADFPDIPKFESWVELFDQASTQKHRIMSAGSFDSFLRSRRASSVHTRVLTSSSDEGVSGLVLRVTVESKRGDLELTFPNELRGHTFSKARQKVNRVGDELVSGELETSQTNYSGLSLRRVKLDSGFNTLDLYFEAP
ncbi:MAG: hypothetical protein R3E66_09535 [bacterium]